MKIDRLRTTLTACTALLLATATGAEPSNPTDLARFAGEWRRSDRERNDSDRSASIKRSTEDMPFWARAFARALIDSSTTPPERYTIRITPTGLSIADGDDEPTPAFVDTEPDNGEDARIMAQMADGTLRQHWRHGEASYGTTFWAVNDAHELVVAVVAYDARLRGAGGEPHAIRYATSYSLDPDATSFGLSE
ncbi:MAG: hypothetical protein JRH16_00485 [Deltaproteobacteria bacterium]|nr:hypothetical protein [Deltaproteobacteria bacterium]